MDLRRLRAGEWIVGLSGAALLVSLFLPWYDGPGGGRLSGWEAFAVTDLALAVVAACAVSLVPVTATQRVPALPIALDAIVALLGIVATVLVVVRLLALPGDAEELAGGIWLGLGAAVALVVGGWIAMRDERISPPGRHTDLTGRPIPPRPEVPPTPAPRP
jgi:hypothetical protein